VLPKVLKGEAEPATAAERIELATLCQLSCKRLHATAARLAADAFAADPKLVGKPEQWHRYCAACSAAQAAAGQANDAKLLPDRVALALRRQALIWLQADLAIYAKLVQRDDPQAKATVLRRMTHWQQDADFASVRGKEALDRLPDERNAWRQLWDDVEALRKQAAGEK